MPMRVVREQLSQVSPQLYRKLHSLNLRDDGDMQGWLTHQRQEKEGVVHYILDGEKLIGWALLFWDRQRMYCHLYVRENKRHQGYGKQLLLANIKYVRRLGKTFKVTSDGSNREFFKRVKQTEYNEPSGKYSNIFG